MSILVGSIPDRVTSHCAGHRVLGRKCSSDFGSLSKCGAVSYRFSQRWHLARQIVTFIGGIDLRDAPTTVLASEPGTTVPVGRLE